MDQEPTKPWRSSSATRSRSSQGNAGENGDWKLENQSTGRLGFNQSRSDTGSSFHRGNNGDQGYGHRSGSRRGSGSSRGRGRGNFTDGTSNFGRQGNGVRPQRNYSKPFDLDRLRELLDKTEFTVIQSINQDLEEWKTFLKEDAQAEDEPVRQLGFNALVRRPSQPSNDDEKLSLVVFLGEKVCSETTVLRTAQTKILEAIANCEKFMDKITAKFMQLAEHGPEDRRGTLGSAVPWDLVRFIRCLVNIGRFMSRLMRTTAVSFVNKIYSGAFCMFNTWDMKEKEISNELQSMRKELEDLRCEKEEWEKVINDERSQGKRSRAIGLSEQTELEMTRLHDEPPPDDFRRIPVVPDAEELRSPEASFIRALKVSGAYNDAEHYLDVQFRLLRENAVRPMKDGIQEYLESKEQNSRVRLKGNHYENVTLLKAEYVKGETVQYIQLPEKHWKKIEWKNSKRLSDRNLLVLTPDDFETTLFAVVYIRDERHLTENGSFGVIWHNPFSRMLVDLSRWDSFLMVESEVYFESYKHTLEVLKTLDLDSFQMSKFIVQVSTDVRAPKYLQEAFMRIGSSTISPLNLDQWPTADQLGLGKRQYAAYQACLTREFSIVQGPPGTGKTFLGLKVVETLLLNRRAWRDAPQTRRIRRYRERDCMYDDCGLDPWGSRRNRKKWDWVDIKVESGGPILVVCYTNHALDQFLEGILKIFSDLDEDPKLIRVGGRSSSSAMNQFSLHEKRTIWSTKRREWEEATALRRAGGELRELDKDFADVSAELQFLKSYSGVAHLDKLSFKQGLLSEREDIKNDDIPFMRDWINNCSTLEYFGYHRSEFMEASQTDIDKLIFERFGVRPEADDDLPKTAAGIGLPRSGMTSKNPSSIARDAIGMEDYDHDELMQKRLVEDNKDDYEGVPTGEERLLPDLCEGHIRPFKTNLEQREWELHLLENPPPPPEEINAVQLQILQREMSEKMAMVRASIKTLQRQMSPLLAFKQYVCEILKLKRKKKLEFPVPFDKFFYEKNWMMLSEKERWGIYFWLVEKAISVGSDACYSKEGRLKRAREHWQDLRNELDGQLLNESLIVGMTTTGAAKYNSLLRRAQAKIVIVEEAAEVLESHVVTCITQACQQLILIGDHQQLRPNVNVHELAVKYHLDISLFERMVKNNLNCLTLDLQHRMRPEIADLVVGTIYNDLKNAPNVYEYPTIQGVTSNLFFLSHNHTEDGVEDGRSKSNEFEAEFLIAFCRYLTQQGYDQSQITILTTYAGQMSILKKLRGVELQDVRTTTVDDFQGEENDIILLSLVRSNEAGNIGFVKADNRVCVALSRAKHGLFIVGNMDQLSQKSQTWKMIQEKLKNRGEIGTSLPIQCEVHKTVKNITNAAQFEQIAPKGGCCQLCLTPLDCGHICSSVCHVTDRDHTKYKCPEPCTKACIRNHPCKAQCYQDCSAKCMIKLQKTPDCGHERTIPCYLFDELLKCTTLVTKELPCEHSADLACFKDPEDYTCRTKVIKKLLCGHEKELECNKSIYKFQCRKMFEKTLHCGHTQMEYCNVPIEDAKCLTEVEVEFLHCDHKEKKKCHARDPSCSVPCSAVLDCGHRCLETCHAEDDPEHLRYKCKIPCAIQCDKGHKCKESHDCGRPCKPCQETVLTKLPCGHQREIECHQDPAVVTCMEECVRILECNHKCQNECYEDCGPCEIIVNKESPCGHSVLAKCSEPITSSHCKIQYPAPFKSPCGHSVTIPCSKRLEVSRLKLEEYCTAPNCNFQVPAIDESDLEGLDRFLSDDDEVVTEMDQLSLEPQF